MSNAPVAIVKTPNATVNVQRAGQVLDANPQDQLKWGDVLTNNSRAPLEIRIPARGAGQGETLLVLQPGASARLEESGSDVQGAESRTKVVALSDGVQLFDVDDDVSSAYLEQGNGAMAGLVGAGLLAGGSGGGLLLGGLAALGLAASGGGDSGNNTDTTNTGSNGSGLLGGLTGGGTAGGTNGGTSGGTGSTTTSGGLAGGVGALSDSVNQTPLAPVSAATDGVSSGLTTVGDGLAGVSAQDPTGTANLLATVIGTSTGGTPVTNDGLVGVVNAVSSGLADGAAGTPLAPVIDPLTQTLGSTDGMVSGVAAALGEIGNVLAGDQSALAPITADLLAPIVGTMADSGTNNGIPGAVLDVGQGLTDLTKPTSALASLSPVTDAVSNSLLSPVASGVETIGQTLVDNSASDPSGLLNTVGTLLGGDSTGGTVSAGEFSNPLDSLLAGGASSGLSGGLLSGSLGGSDGLVGVLHDTGAALSSVSAGTPLASVVEPVSMLVGSSNGAISGLAAGVGDIGNVLAGDHSALAPVTNGLLAPVVGTTADTSTANGIPGTLLEVGHGLTDLTNPNSALAPLNPVTEAVSTNVLSPVAGGIETVGQAVVDNSAADPSGLTKTVGTLLGGDLTAVHTSSSISTAPDPTHLIQTNVLNHLG